MKKIMAHSYVQESQEIKKTLQYSVKRSNSSLKLIINQNLKNRNSIRSSSIMMWKWIRSVWPQKYQKLWLRFLKMFQCKKRQLHMNHSSKSLDCLLYKKVQSLENEEEAMMRILKLSGRIFLASLEKLNQINQAKSCKREENLTNKKTNGTVILLRILGRKSHVTKILKN